MNNYKAPNIKEQIHDSNYPRARIVDKNGSVTKLQDYKELFINDGIFDMRGTVY